MKINITIDIDDAEFSKLFHKLSNKSLNEPISAQKTKTKEDVFRNNDDDNILHEDSVYKWVKCGLSVVKINKKTGKSPDKTPDHAVTLINTKEGHDHFKTIQQQWSKTHKVVKIYRRFGGWNGQSWISNSYSYNIPFGKAKHATHFDVYLRPKSRYEYR